MGLPLDTTAAQPKLKLYRYVSPSLSRSLFLPLSPVFYLSLSLFLSLPTCRFLFLTCFQPLFLSLPLSLPSFLPLSLSVYIYLSVSLSLSFHISRFPACFSFSPLPRLSPYIYEAL